MPRLQCPQRTQRAERTLSPLRRRLVVAVSGEGLFVQTSGDTGADAAASRREYAAAIGAGGAVVGTAEASVRLRFLL